MIFSTPAIIAMISSATGTIISLAMAFLVLWQAPRARTNQMMALFMLTVVGWGVTIFTGHFLAPFIGGQAIVIGSAYGVILSRSFNALTLFALVTAYYDLWSKRWVQVVLAVSLIYRFGLIIPLLFQGKLFNDIVLLSGGEVNYQIEPLGFLALFSNNLYYVASLAILWRAGQKRSPYLLIGTFILLIGVLVVPTQLGRFSAVITLAAIAGVFFTYAILRENLFNPLIRLNEALAQQKADLSEAQRIAKIGSWSWDTRANEVTWSPQIYELFGVLPHVSPSMKLFVDMIHSQDRDHVVQVMQDVFASGSSGYATEYRVVQHSGSIRFVSATAQVTRDEVGQSLLVLGVLQDITERKEAEALVARARDQALAASRLKSELLAKVSHELRTPLGAILGFAELLQTGAYGAISGQQQRVTTEIIDSAQYLTTLVNELLDQAQLEAGRLRLKVGPFALREMVEQVTSKMKLLAQAKGLTLICEVADDLPMTLSGDRDRLQQILVNLVSNAIKFSEMGTIRVQVHAADATHWVLVVADSGPGIPVEARTRIFEPFGQVDASLTRNHDGTGLGLSIVKQLTELMDGQINLESEVGQGSTFAVRLPLQATQEVEG